MNIESLVSNIIKSSKCPMCGGNSSSGTCIYCGVKNNDVVAKIDTLKSVLSTSTLLQNDLNSIYLLKDLNISEVNRLLEDKKIDSCFYELGKNYDAYISGEKVFQDHEYDLFKKCLINNKLPLVGIDDKVIDILIKKMILEKDAFTIEEKESIFSSFAKEISRTKVGAKKLIVNFSEDIKCKGLYFDGISKVTISKSMLEKNPIDACKTIFHELHHQDQELSIKKGKLSALNFLMIMDEINRKEFGDSYYDDNYRYLTSELHAELAAIRDTITYADNIHVKVPEELLNEYKAIDEILNQYITNNQFQFRKYKDENMLVGGLFSMAVYNKPEYLEEYPQIGFGYKIVGNNLVPKFSSELASDYEKFKNGSLTWDGDPNEINLLYQNGIVAVKQTEEYIKANNIEDVQVVR